MSLWSLPLKGENEVKPGGAKLCQARAELPQAGAELCQAGAELFQAGAELCQARAELFQAGDELCQAQDKLGQLCSVMPELLSLTRINGVLSIDPPKDDFLVKFSNIVVHWCFRCNRLNNTEV